MKKLFYSALALAGIFAVSCNKEVDAPVVPQQSKGEKVQYTIKAFYNESDDVRTAYADNKTFSWVAGDSVYVRCIDANDEYWGWRGFVAQESGAETTLVAELEDGWRPYDTAVYQAHREVASVSYNDATVRVSMPISYHLDGYGMDAEAGTPYYNSVSVPSDNPLSVLPLVGLPQEDGSLKFQTGVGVLKVNLTDVDPSATHVRITASEGYLGNYMMVKDGEIRMTESWADTDGQLYSVSFLEYYFAPVSDGKVSFYLPVPVGTLPVGSTVSVMDASNKVLFSQTVKKDITIARNKVIELAALSTKVSWISLGTGKFVDNYLWEVIGAAADTYVDVEIQKSATQAGYYRIVNPYGAAATAFNYTPAYTVIGPQDIIIRTLSVGEALYGVKATIADQLYYEETYTGIDASDDYLDEENTEADLEYSILHPSSFRNFPTEYDWGRNLIAKYGTDGNPANVILAPIYYWGGGYWSGNNPIHQTNSLIQVLFPGVATAVALDSSVSFGEIVDDSPEQAIVSASIALGNDVASAKVVVAASLDAAKAAIDANQNVTVVSASGDIEVKLPANAPSGDYMVVAYTQAKDGFTAAANQYITTATFKYFNVNDDAGYTIADIVGTYNSDPLHVAYYSGGWKWNANQVNKIVIEESDDDFLGNVKITEVTCDADTFGYNLVTTEEYPGIYGQFNTATGEVVFEGVQPLYNTGFPDANNPCAFVGQREDDGSEFFLSAAGKLVHTGQSFIGAVVDGAVTGYYRIIGGYGDRDYNYTRQAAASGVAVKSPARRNYVEIPADFPGSISVKGNKVPFGVRR